MAGDSESTTTSGAWPCHCFFLSGSFPVCPDGASPSYDLSAFPGPSPAENKHVARKKSRGELENMRIGKTIGGKLYWGFGGILVVVVFLSLLALIAARDEQTNKDMYTTAIS